MKENMEVKGGTEVKEFEASDMLSLTREERIEALIKSVENESFKKKCEVLGINFDTAYHHMIRKAKNEDDTIRYYLDLQTNPVRALCKKHDLKYAKVQEYIDTHEGISAEEAVQVFLDKKNTFKKKFDDAGLSDKYQAALSFKRYNKSLTDDEIVAYYKAKKEGTLTSTKLTSSSSEDTQ